MARESDDDFDDDYEDDFDTGGQVRSTTLASNSSRSGQPEVKPFSQGTVRWFKYCVIVLGLIGILVAIPAAFVLGSLAGSRSVRNEIASAKRAQIETLIEQDEKYKRIKFEYGPEGDLRLSGSIPVNRDFMRLEGQLTRMFGEASSKHLMRLVSLEAMF